MPKQYIRKSGLSPLQLAIRLGEIHADEIARGQRRRSTPEGLRKNREAVARSRAKYKDDPTHHAYQPGHWNEIHGVEDRGCPGCHQRPVPIPGYPTLQVCGGCSGHLFQCRAGRWFILFTDEITDPETSPKSRDQAPPQFSSSLGAVGDDGTSGEGPGTG